MAGGFDIFFAADGLRELADDDSIRMPEFGNEIIFGERIMSKST